MPPMSERVRRIKSAIESRQDFTGLANGGEAEVFRYARSIGRRGGELVIEWQQSYRQRHGESAGAATALARRRETPKATRVETANFADLDDWSGYERAAICADDAPANQTCQCECDACRAGNCADCSNEDCDDPSCIHRNGDDDDEQEDE